MQKQYKTIIVGGGAAGLLAGVELLKGSNAFLGEEVLILERCDRVGKKLIATGNGQGNLMNEKFGEEFYYGDKGFIQTFVSKAKELGLKKYLAELGIFLSASKDGKFYPLSKQASSVLDSIRGFLVHKNCTVLTGKRVTKVIKMGSGFEIHAGLEKFYAKTVIMATGGSAGKQFGTDGSAYGLALGLGHKLTDLYPSLVQLKTPTHQVKGLKGIKETARVTAFVGGKPIMSAEGDLLFTDFGVSGSTIFTLSASIADKKGAYLIAEFLPKLSFSQTEKIIEKRMNLSYLEKEDLLCGIINKKIGQKILKNAKTFTMTDIAYAVKNFKLTVIGSLDFSYAQTTRGGIKTDKIDPETYMSKLANGFYIVGEALDVDGDCGGYNLTFAFTSGIIAGRNIKESFNG